jgi:hypothetical protein
MATRSGQSEGGWIMSEATGTKVQLDHERLDAYTIAVALDGAVVALARKAGRGHHSRSE